MPELPEMASRAREMKSELVGKTITAIQVLQPKCLNLPPDEFAAALRGGTVLDVTHRGKWVRTETARGWLLLNLGMGGEILLLPQGQLPPKRRVVLDLDDGQCLAINFWWFGYAHYAPTDGLNAHAMTAKLGVDALELTAAQLGALCRGQRQALKALLLDQAKIAGIGNYYIHDILFRARLHPGRQARSLSESEIARLTADILTVLGASLDKGGAFYELNLYGQPGGFRKDDTLIGYAEGKPCPICATPIERIRTGSTQHFLCPKCQPVEG